MGFHSVMKLVHHCDELLWATKLFHNLPEALAVHRVKRLGEVHEGCVEVLILLQTFFLELSGGKHHVHSSATFSEAALTLR